MENIYTVRNPLAILINNNENNTQNANLIVDKLKQLNFTLRIYKIVTNDALRQLSIEYGAEYDFFLFVILAYGNLRLFKK